MKGKKLKRRLSMLLSSMLAATCILNSIPVGAVSSRSVIEDNIALGCSYEASVASHGSYPDSGGELTDGQIGINSFYDGKWAGWSGNGDTPVEITIDLESVQSFSKVEAVTLNNNSAGGIKYPLSIQFDYSVDGSTWTSIASEPFPSDAPNDSVYTYSYTLPEEVQGQYVKLSFPANRWAFFSEIRVLHVYEDTTPTAEEPTIHEDLPDKLTKMSGDTVTLSVDASVSGEGTLSYQWYKDGAPIGANSSSLTLENITTNDQGSYHVVITNTENALTASVTSTTCVLNVQKEQTGDENNIISGLFYVTNLRDGDANAGTGDFSGSGDVYRSKLTDGQKAAYGAGYSAPEFLLMHWPLKEEERIVHISFDFGSTKSFQQVNIGAWGGGSGIHIPSNVLIEYQKEDGSWTELYNGSLPKTEAPAYQQLVYAVPRGQSVTGKGIRFAFAVSGSWMCLDEIEVLAEGDGSVPNINPPAEFSDQPVFTEDLPASLIRKVGDKITLSVHATVQDGGTLSYQWYKGGSKIGTDSDTYEIASATEADSGSYYVVVTNSKDGLFNTAESANCFLTVQSSEDPQPSNSLIQGITYVTSYRDGDAAQGKGDFHASHPDVGRTRLTDGLKANKWGDAATVGYNAATAKKPLDITFSFDTPKTFQEIQLGAFGGDSGIGMPSDIKIEMKNGGDEWIPLYSGSTTAAGPGKRYVFTSLYDADITATDLRFTIGASGSWIFLDEIEVFEKATGETPFAEMEMNFQTQNNNLALGLPYECSYEASSSYPDTNHTELTDGKYATTSYAHSGWAGFLDNSGVNPVDITFDLGQVKSFEEIKFNNLRSGSVGIKLFKNVRIQVSNDKENWTELVYYNIPEATVDTLYYQYKYTAYEPVKARYVRVSFGFAGWGFVDEIEILAQAEGLADESNNLALHQSYTSNPAADPAYPDTVSLTKLTDGRTGAADMTQLAWVGYQAGSGNNEIVVDLGKEASFEQVGANFLNDVNNNILVPSQVNISYSSDGNSWKDFAQKALSAIDSDAPVVYAFKAASTTAASGRYVKFSFPAQNRVFVDEIGVYVHKIISADPDEADPMPLDTNDIAIGSTYTTSIAPSSKYPDHDYQLTNGKRANPIYSDSQWVGYQPSGKDEPLTITLDLGQSESFEQVKIGFIESLAQLLNVYIPKDITVEYSDDNSSWKTYQATTKLERHAGYNVLRFYSDQNSVTARYLKFTMTLQGLTFIDQIEVLKEFVPGVDSSMAPDNAEVKNLVRGSSKVGVSRPADFRNAVEVLTDGLYGVTGSQYDQNWMGFQKSSNTVNNHVMVDLDLTAMGSVSKVVVHSREDSGVGVTTPQNLKFYASYNMKTWSYVADFKAVAGENGKVELVWDGAADGFNASAEGSDAVYTRYIRIEFDVPENGYAYLDEVQVYGKMGKCSNASLSKGSDGLYNVAAGKSYEVLPFRGPTQHPDADNLEITDLNFGTESLEDSAWSELNQNEMQGNNYVTRWPLREIIVDLGDVKTITKTRLQLTGVFNMNFRRPWAVYTYASMDGETWTPLSRNYSGGIWGSGFAAYGWHNTDSSGTDHDQTGGAAMMAARYVRVDVEPWFAALVSELEVFGYDGHLEGAAVAENGRLLEDGQEFQHVGESTGGINDLVLCYNGFYNVGGNPEYGNWNRSDFRPYLTYIDEDGKAVDTMFDGILLLGLRSQYGRYFMQTGDTDHLQEEDWYWYLDKTFGEGGDVDELNEAAKIAAEELNDPDYKVKLVVMDPGIYTSHTKFGYLGGDHVLNFKVDADWKYASEWWLSEVERRFNEGNYDHVELAGYYWLDEQYGFGETLWYQEYHRQWVHDHGYKFYWIPMSPANGYLWGHDVGFDAVAFQPGHYFTNPYEMNKKGYLGTGYVENCIGLASYGNMTIEFEMDPATFTNHAKYNQFLDYLNAAQMHGIGEPSVYRAWYQDVKAVLQAAYSGNETVRSLYDYMYQLKNGEYEVQPYIDPSDLGDDPMLFKIPGYIYEGHMIGGNGTAIGGGSSSGGGSGGGSTTPSKPTDPGTSTDGYTWEEVDGSYKLKDADGEYVTGWAKVDGKWYYLNADGIRQTGWQKVGNDWYYLKADGVMATGWLKLGNTWYFLNAGGVMQTGWLYNGGVWYYLYEWGGMANTSWVQVGNTWYYFRGNGAMMTGWLQQGTTWYYLKDSGAMAIGWNWVNANCYYFAANGKMAANTTIGGYKVDANGAWVK